MSRLPLTEKIEALGWRRTISLEDGIKKMLLESNIEEREPLEAVAI